MTDWLYVFGSVVRQVRACGWTCAFVLHGQRFRPIGIAGAGAPLPHNDNRKRG